MLGSMSRRANCRDNAPMESFWLSLKNGKTPREHYATRTHAASAIREWLEILYHHCCRHSRLGYQRPAFFTSHYRTRQRQAAWQFGVRCWQDTSFCLEVTRIDRSGNTEHLRASLAHRVHSDR